MHILQTDLNVEITIWIGKEGRKKQDDNELLHHCFPLYLAQNMPEWYRVGTEPIKRQKLPLFFAWPNPFLVFGL